MLSAFSALAEFAGTNGYTAEGSLAIDAAGNLFGVTLRGGPASTASDDGYSQPGEVFEVPAATGTLTVLAAFNGTDGAGPDAGPILTSDGNVYGTASGGGADGDGVVWEVAAGSGAITVRGSFSGADGQSPQASLILDTAGDLLGTATAGGANGDGDIFEVAAGTDTITDLADFTGANGSDPLSRLVTGPNGVYYGTTRNGGASGLGTVYSFDPTTKDITTLYSFAGADGERPESGVYVDAAGDLFGTTDQGGTNQSGAFYELDPTTDKMVADVGATSVTLNPDGDLAPGPADTLYGTSYDGGTGDGSLFSLDESTLTPTVLYSFGDASDGAAPTGGVVTDSVGILYGTTSGGGTLNVGTVFAFDPFSTTPTPTPTPTPTTSLTPTITKSTLPADAVAGGTAKGTVTVTVADSGSAAVKGKVTVEVLASPDGATADATALGSASKMVKLKPGGSVPVAVPVKSLGSLPSGTYSLIAEATDPSGVVTASAAGGSLSVAAPTVSFTETITKVTLPASSVAGAKTKAVATIVVANGGNVTPTKDSELALFLTPDGVPADGEQVALLPEPLKAKPGKATTVKVPLKAIPALAAGQYFVAVQVTDLNGNVTTAVSAAKYTITAAV
jgi:uncharacterized repeat protein (TIGR03803 family)